MDIADRLRMLVDYYAMSDRGFALRCGLKQATFDKQMRRARAVSMDTAIAILSTFGNVSAEWLIRGEGAMLRDAKPLLPDYDKINRLVDTINLLQEIINEKNKTIKLLSEQINQLKTQIK